MYRSTYVYVFDAIKSGDPDLIYEAYTKALLIVQPFAVGDGGIVLADGNRYKREHLSIAGESHFRGILADSTALFSEAVNRLSAAKYDFTENFKKEDLTRKESNNIGAIQAGLQMIDKKNPLKNAPDIIQQLLEGIDPTGDKIKFEVSEEMELHLKQLNMYFQSHLMIKSIHDHLDFENNRADFWMLLKSVLIDTYEEECELDGEMYVITYPKHI